MKKRIRLNNDKVKKLVTEKLRQDGTLIQETKIDKAIKQYLIERTEDKDPESAPEATAFSKKAKKTLNDMATALMDIVEDLRIIQTKEPDVLIEMYPKEIYSEFYLEELIYDVESVLEHIEYLYGLEDMDSEDFDYGK